MKRLALGLLLMAASPAWAEDTATERANKLLVVTMWHEFLDAHDVTAAKKYIAEGYIQHNPNAGQGLKGVTDYFASIWKEPRKPGTYEPTKFDQVIAKDDFVQLLIRRPRPDPKEPGKTYDSFWFDLFRVKDGKIVEHWDSALKQ